MTQIITIIKNVENLQKEFVILVLHLKALRYIWTHPVRVGFNFLAYFIF